MCAGHGVCECAGHGQCVFLFSIVSLMLQNDRPGSQVFFLVAVLLVFVCLFVVVLLLLFVVVFCVFFLVFFWGGVFWCFFQHHRW